MLVAQRQHAEGLEAIMQAMRRHRFGRRAETPLGDQLLLGLEDVEQTTASDTIAAEARSKLNAARRPSGSPTEGRYPLIFRASRRLRPR